EPRDVRPKLRERALDGGLQLALALAHSYRRAPREAGTRHGHDAVRAAEMFSIVVAGSRSPDDGGRHLAFADGGQRLLREAKRHELEPVARGQENLRVRAERHGDAPALEVVERGERKRRGPDDRVADVEEGLRERHALAHEALVRRETEI